MSKPTATLIADRKARRVTRAEMQSLPAPSVLGPRHAPQHAAHFVDVLSESLRVGGFEVKHEEFALYRNDAVLIGVMDLVSTDPALRREGQNPSIALRTSINQAFATTLGTGQRLLVCSNGCFHAERLVLRRKSTTGMRLQAEVSGAVARFQEQSIDLLRQMDRAKEISLSDERAKVIMFDEFQRKTLPPSKLPRVASWFFDPPGGATDLTEAPRSLFALQNAFTREARSLPLGRRYEVSARLGRLLTAL